MPGVATTVLMNTIDECVCKIEKINLSNYTWVNLALAIAYYLFTKYHATIYDVSLYLLNITQLYIMYLFTY